MGLMQKLRNRNVFLDTAPLIYYIEEKAPYSTVLNKLFLENSNGVFLFQTSVITLLEVLVLPMRMNEIQLVEQYQNILSNSSTINILYFTTETAKTVAAYRAKYGLKTPDAIQIATAVNASADYFLTNDIRLKAVQEIDILILDELIKS